MSFIHFNSIGTEQINSVNDFSRSLVNPLVNKMTDIHSIVLFYQSKIIMIDIPQLSYPSFSWIERCCIEISSYQTLSVSNHILFKLLHFKTLHFQNMPFSNPTIFKPCYFQTILLSKCINMNKIHLSIIKYHHIQPYSLSQIVKI